MSGRRLAPAFLSLVAGLLLSAPYAVQAQDQPGGPPAQGRDPAAMYTAVGCTPEQVTNIRSLMDGYGTAQRARNQVLFTLMRDMQSLSMQPDPNPQMVMGKQDEINRAMAESANEKMKLMLNIRAVLTPDQKQKLVQMMQPRAQAPAASTPPAGN